MIAVAPDVLEPPQLASKPTKNGRLLATRISREEQKERTRQALLTGTLDLLQTQSFDSVSLRSVTRRAGVVPTAFYRHFENLDELGLALVDEALGSLRAMLREVRERITDPEAIIRESVSILVEHVKARPNHFRFIAREWHGGSRILRDAIQEQIDEFTNDLAKDLAAFPFVKDWPDRDQQMLAHLIVTIIVDIAAQLVDRPDAEEHIVHRAQQQVLLVVMGIPHWRRA